MTLLKEASAQTPAATTETTLKSILVHVEGTPEASPRLHAAVDLARTFDATLLGVGAEMLQTYSDPYGMLGVKKVVYTAGDVAARVHTRFEETHESLRLIGLIARAMPRGDGREALPAPRPGAFGMGWIEGWRGEVLVALEAGEGGRIRRCHAHDPSRHNWPVVQHAVMGNIVPDFPLINKSFNLSYSGSDL